MAQLNALGETDIQEVKFDGVDIDIVIIDGVTVYERFKPGPWNLLHNGSTSHSTSNSLYVNVDAVQVKIQTRRNYSSWGAYLRGTNDNNNGNWWCGSSWQDGGEEWIAYMWDKPRWIEKIQVQSVQSSHYKATPNKYQVWCLIDGHTTNATSGSWIYMGDTYISSDFTTQNQWRDLNWKNIKDRRGIYGVKLRWWSNGAWDKNATAQCTRMNDIRIYAANVRKEGE